MFQLVFFLWALFFIILAFSMMPGYMTFICVISFVGGVLSAIAKNRETKKKRPNFKLEKSEKVF